MAKNQNRALGDRLRDKFRLIIYNDNTFEEVWYLRLTRLNMFALISTIFILIVVGVFALVAYTSIRELIPGYPDGNMRRTILMNAVRLDSLENEIRMRDQYFNNIRALVAGEEPDNLVNLSDTTIEPSNVDFSKSTEDSLLRLQIEQEEQYNLTSLTLQGAQGILPAFIFLRRSGDSLPGRLIQTRIISERMLARNPMRS